MGLFLPPGQRGDDPGHTVKKKRKNRTQWHHSLYIQNMTLQQFPLIFFFFFLCIAKPVFLLFIGVDGRNPRRTLDIIYIEIFECYKKM